MKKFITLSFAFIMVAMVNAQWKKVKGNGTIVTVERTTGDYDAIAVSGFFDVDLVEGEEGTLILKGEENLLDHVVTEVEGNKLILKVEKGYNLRPSSWDKDHTIRITVPIQNIDEVTLSGSGDIVGKKTLKTANFKTRMSGSGDITLDVDANSVEATMSGSGDITLSGSTQHLDVSVSGSGDVEAYDLDAQTVEATVSGSANVKVTAKEMLKARVSGSGDIRYRGNPKLDSKSSGSGDISKG